MLRRALVECLARETQDPGGLELIGVGELQDGGEKNAIEFELRLGVQVRASQLEPFQEESPRLLERVEAAVRSANPEQLRTAAHAARGLVAFFSTRATKAAEVLEQMGIDGRAVEAAEQYQVLNQAVDELRTILPHLTIERLRAQSELARQRTAPQFASRLFTFHWLIAAHPFFRT
jgi:hypothetical protein